MGWLFNRRKEKKELEQLITDAKFKLNESVYFRYRNELRIGIVKKIYRANDDGRLLYTIVIGGECPAVIEAVEENLLVKMPK